MCLLAKVSSCNFVRSCNFDTDPIFVLVNEFGCRFADFKKVSAEFDIVQSPFTADFGKAPHVVQLELIDLQCDYTLKENFQSYSIDTFYALLNTSKFANWIHW